MRFNTFSAGVGGVAVLLALSTAARGADIYVPQQYASIQEAIDSAAPGDTIILGSGTFGGGVYWGAKPLIIRGQGAGITYVDGGFTGNCLTIDSLPSDSRVEGITFQNGFADGGGAILCRTSHLTIAACEFTGNQAFFDGGAILIQGGAPSIDRCHFQNNSTTYGCGGAVCSTGAAASLSGCEFTGNSADAAGGAVASLGGADTMTGCKVVSNTAAEGGGAAFLNGSARAIDCVFSSNAAFGAGGGAASGGSDSLFLNCAFWKNTASIHGGGAWFNGDGSVLNSSFARNTSNQSGGAVAAQGGTAKVVNSILWFDGTSETWADSFQALSITHSNVMGWTPPGGNMSADPMYVDPATGDLRVQPGSPGIDQGVNDPALSASPTDLAGNPRILGPAVDMGAYETKVQVDPSALIRALKEVVTGLVKAGANLPAKGNSLQAKLDAALADLGAADKAGAATAVQDFMNQVSAFMKTGRLTAEQGKPLLDSANSILAVLAG